MTIPPEDAASYAARLAATLGVDNRPVLDPDGAFGWDTFPFEVDALRPKRLAAAQDEPDRHGEGERPECGLGDCSGPSPEWPVLWRDGEWALKAAPPSGSPLVVVLEPRRHVDIPGLTSAEAARFGQLCVAVMAAVESLPSVGRCQILRSGDGAAHGHVWFVSRPARMPQVRGSWLILWDELLPAVPAAVRDANAHAVVERLIDSSGGSRASAT